MSTSSSTNVYASTLRGAVISRHRFAMLFVVVGLIRSNRTARLDIDFHPAFVVISGRLRQLIAEGQVVRLDLPYDIS